MTDRSHLGRAAQCFERHNAPDIRRDRVCEWIATLRPVLWLLLALGAVLLVLHVAPIALANAAAPVNPPY